MRRRRRDLRAIDRNHSDRDQPRLRAELEHAPEQTRDRVLGTDAEPRDRRVVGRLVRGQNSERDILATAPLDPARRPHPDRIGVNQRRGHHRRVVRRAAHPSSR
jgi:hypothetical protein